MKQAIELEIANPNITQEQLAAAVGKSVNQIHNYQHSPIYQEELDRRLREETRRYAVKAMDQMMRLSEQGNFNATKYLLDYSDFGSKQEVSLSTDNGFVINIVNNDTD